MHVERIQLMLRSRVGGGIAAFLAALALVAAEAAPASAFDTGPHQDLTAEAMGAEGFSVDAVGVSQVSNWLCDIYEQAALNPFSGRAPFYKRLLATAISIEQWPDDVVTAATRCHFDEDTPLGNTADETAEWERLQRATWTVVREAREEDDPLTALTALGISLHKIQDFYAHTNWVESRRGHGASGSDGPGWQERGFGSNPTWFDVPAADRNAATIYSDTSKGHRPHGYWNTDGNNSVRTGMNKDWAGRPYFMPAVTTAYFASRQWIETVRAMVDDEAFWSEMTRFRADRSQRFELEHDLFGTLNISRASGHWQGEGEPLGGEHGYGGSLTEAREALKSYFEAPIGESIFRSRFEQVVERIDDLHPTGQLVPVPSSQPLQRTTKFVVLRITGYHGEGLGDPGPDQADDYANVRIDGQPMTSAIIHGQDSFSFPRPYAPFTWIKAVPANVEEEEPVESIQVTVNTGNDLWAGTDDDIYLRLGSGLRLGPLDRRLTTDFERGDSDTYSVPIDEAVRNGLRVGDIRRVELEKSPDGVAGGWELGGVKLVVNGRQVYDNQQVDRWLEDDHLTWTAPDFVPSRPRGAEIPVWLNLRESDAKYGGDDEGDINPDDARDTVQIGYPVGPPLQGETTGGNRYGGRLGIGGDGASLSYSLETLTPELMQATQTAAAPPAPPQEPKLDGEPDLTIASFSPSGITIANRGTEAAGAFRVKIDHLILEFSGLAAGASEFRPLALSCFGEYTAEVDDLDQVEESNEANNKRASEAQIC
jgi:PLAT/LH2 domain